MGVRVVFNGPALQSLTIAAGDADLRVRANRVLSAARRGTPVDTGRLRASLTVQFLPGPVARIGSAEKHAIMVHEGTGIYGPTGRPITPKNGTFLRWPATNNSGAGRRRYKGGRTEAYVYARSVKGMKGRPFLRDALEAAR